MIMGNSEINSGKYNDSQYIRTLLMERGLISLDEIISLISSSADEIMEHLDQFIDNGDIEKLQPVTQSDLSNHNGVTFYRWRRPTDQDYLWQHRLHLRGRRRTHQRSNKNTTVNVKPWDSAVALRPHVLFDPV